MNLITLGINLNVTPINPTTKKAEHMIHAYEKSTASTIWQAYGKPSDRKVSAYQKIVKEMSEAKGYGMRITGAGSDIFSCAYVLKDPEGHRYLIYHTPSNRFAIKYE